MVDQTKIEKIDEATADLGDLIRSEIDDLRAELASEQARFVNAARDADAEGELAALQNEAERLRAQIAAAKADADHQERSVGLLPPVESTPAPAPLFPSIRTEQSAVVESPAPVVEQPKSKVEN